MPPGRRAPTLGGATSRRVWVVLLATLCVVVAAGAGPWQPAERVTGNVAPVQLVEPPALPEPVPPDRVDRAVASATTEPGLVWVWRLLVVAVTAVLLFLLVRWALNRELPTRVPRPEPVATGPPVGASERGPEPDLAVLGQGARAAAEHLRTAADPVDAVIAAWVALEDAAGRSGLVRVPSATATEFTLEVLDRTAADPAAARTLLALYLRARFDDAPLGADDVRVAADAARALVGALAGGGRVHPAPRVVDGPGAGGAPAVLAGREDRA